MSVPSVTLTHSVGDIVAFTILFYDHLLTFPAEVRYFWRRRRCSWGVVLFFVNRYFALWLHSFNISRTFLELQYEPKVSRCATIQLVEQAGVVASQIFCAAIMAMRVYALYEKSRPILALLSAVAVGVVAIGLWAVFLTPAGTGNAEFKCNLDPAHALHIAIGWSGQLIFDAIVFVLTAWRSYSIGKTGQRSLVDTLLRDGSVYFAVISVMNAGTIAILLLASSRTKFVIGTFNSALTVIMASRLVLNLQPRQAVTNIEPEDNPGFTMTTVVPFNDMYMSMRVDDADQSWGI